MKLTPKQVKTLEEIKANIGLDPSRKGEHWLLPYNRRYSLFPGMYKVFFADFIERPAYYVMRDARLAKYADLTEDQARDLKGQFRLREVEHFYAQKKITTSNEDPKSKGGVSGPSEGADSGKGAKPPAKEDSSK